MPKQDTEPKKGTSGVQGLEEILLKRIKVIGEKHCVFNGVPADIIKEITAWRDKSVNEAMIAGMEQAKSRVLRRTEIPKDAKNPTRDHIVILGEEIAGFIDDDIAHLNKKGEE